MSNTFVAPEAAVEGTSASAAAPASEASAPAQMGRPASSYGAGSQPQAQPHDPSKPPVKRQIVCFSFYKVMPEWRRLTAAEKA